MSDNFNIKGSVEQLQNKTQDSSQTQNKAGSIITITQLEQIKKESILWSIFFAVITGIVSSIIFELWIKGWLNMK